ncbi:MAG: hypothetical protein EAZ42_02095 [Verrucomicrobia bacterium]|nr:MAG: hypothetical protein EAZ42_02095 [Verrucomicrobiota bacterium]
MALSTEKMDRHHESPRELAAFALAWLRAPLKVGAVVPSSRHLARAITRELTAEMGNIIELGPGTGVFTRAILARGVPAENLCLLENDHQLAGRLIKKFPGVKVVSGCASELATLDIFPRGKVASIISGLPLLSIPDDTVELIMRGAFELLEPQAAVYQFTYRPLCPVPGRVMDRLGLKSSCTHFAMRNIPPAWVFAISRRT